MDSSKPTVTIVGLLPGQADRVQSTYETKIDFKFLGVDESMHRIKATAESTEHLILMTKFLPHEIQTALRKHEGLIFCNGGLSSVGMKLDRLLEK